MSGYVMQDDLLNANLTVRETLHYTAALRLPQSFSAEDRDARVNEVIREMGLLKCQDVMVGDPSRKGISGGERRRLCIGMELLTRPTLLFLDGHSKRQMIQSVLDAQKWLNSTSDNYLYCFFHLFIQNQPAVWIVSLPWH